MAISRAAISFESEGSICAGRMYTPTPSSTPLPCVVMANGFSGTMDWVLPAFAEHFAAVGIATLTFDYRHLGESGGEPRQIVDVQKQRRDLERAVQYARASPYVDPDRVALWGTSLGGSHVVHHAARDPKIAAVVLNMPALDAIKGARVAEKRRRTNTSLPRAVVAGARLLGLAVADAMRGAFGLAPHYIPVYGAPGRAFFADPALGERFETVMAGSPTWQNRIAARFLLRAPRYRKGTIEKIAAPIFVTLAADDIEISNAFVKATVSRAPRADVREYPGGHFDLYHGALLEQVARDQASFLRARLATTTRR